MEPVVTFVVPSTGRPTIEHTLASLLRLSSPAWRAVVGFDAVSDDALAALVLPSDPRITYTRLQAKAGGGRNFGGGVRNQLISPIFSPWVGFVDDDDSLRPDYVDRLVETAGANPDASVVVFRMSYGPDDARVLPPLGTVSPVKNRVGISFAARKAVFDEGFTFRNGPTEDYDLLFSIAHAGHRLVFSPHITYNVRF